MRICPDPTLGEILRVLRSGSILRATRPIYPPGKAWPGGMIPRIDPFALVANERLIMKFQRPFIGRTGRPVGGSLMVAGELTVGAGPRATGPGPAPPRAPPAAPAGASRGEHPAR